MDRLGAWTPGQTGQLDAWTDWTTGRLDRLDAWTAGQTGQLDRGLNFGGGIGEPPMQSIFNEYEYLPS